MNGKGDDENKEKMFCLNICDGNSKKDVDAFFHALTDFSSKLFYYNIKVLGKQEENLEINEGKASLSTLSSYYVIVYHYAKDYYYTKGGGSRLRIL